MQANRTLLEGCATSSLDAARVRELDRAGQKPSGEDLADASLSGARLPNATLAGGTLLPPPATACRRSRATAVSLAHAGRAHVSLVSEGPAEETSRTIRAPGRRMLLHDARVVTVTVAFCVDVNTRAYRSRSAALGQCPKSRSTTR